MARTICPMNSRVARMANEIGGCFVISVRIRDGQHIYGRAHYVGSRSRYKPKHLTGADYRIIVTPRKKTK